MKQKFKDMIERHRWIKWIPNSLTLCNSLCGFASILITYQSYRYIQYGCTMSGIFAFSSAMILFAMVFDAFDGFAARLLNAGSMHGLQMDSLADMVTFGVAPAVLTAVMANNYQPDISCRKFVLISLLCAIYLGCAALRLATYNVHAILEKKSSEKFSGLPSPGAAAAICVVVIFSASAGIDQKIFFPYLLPVYAAILGLLMVSSIPYTHFAKWIISCKRDKRRLTFLILLFVAWAISGFLYKMQFDSFNWYAFPALVVNIYVFWGPIAYFAVKLGLLHAKVQFEDETGNAENQSENSDK